MYDSGDDDAQPKNPVVNGAVLSWLNHLSSGPNAGHDSAMMMDRSGIIGKGQALPLDPMCPTGYYQGANCATSSLGVVTEIPIAGGNRNIVTVGLSSAGVGTRTVIASASSVSKLVTNGPYVGWLGVTGSNLDVSFVPVSGGTPVTFGANYPAIASQQKSNPYMGMVGNAPIMVCQVGNSNTNIWAAYGENLVTGVTELISSVTNTHESSPVFNSSGLAVWSNLTDGNLYGNWLPQDLLSMPGESGSFGPMMSGAGNPSDFLVAHVDGKSLTNPSVSSDYAVFNLAPIQSGSSSFEMDGTMSGSPNIQDGICGVSLSSVPEPGTMVLLAVGGLLVLLRIRHKNRR